MSRTKVKAAIDHALTAATAPSGDLSGSLDALEAAIDELIKEERKAVEEPFLDLIRAEASDRRRDLAAGFLARLIEKHDEGTFDRSIAGRAIGYADDLIRMLNERKP